MKACEFVKEESCGLDSETRQRHSLHSLGMIAVSARSSHGNPLLMSIRRVQKVNASSLFGSF